MKKMNLLVSTAALFVSLSAFSAELDTAILSSAIYADDDQPVPEKKASEIREALFRKLPGLECKKLGGYTKYAINKVLGILIGTDDGGKVYITGDKSQPVLKIVTSGRDSRDEVFVTTSDDFKEVARMDYREIKISEKLFDIGTLIDPKTEVRKVETVVASDSCFPMK